MKLNLKKLNTLYLFKNYFLKKLINFIIKNGNKLKIENIIIKIFKKLKINILNKNINEIRVIKNKFNIKNLIYNRNRLHLTINLYNIHTKYIKFLKKKEKLK